MQHVEATSGASLAARGSMGTLAREAHEDRDDFIEWRFSFKKLALGIRFEF
jgi:hypothetical protein